MKIIEKKLSEARLAFNHINQCRRLPALLETFLSKFYKKIILYILSSWKYEDGLRSNFHLIASEIKEYMDHYEVSCVFHFEIMNIQTL